MKNSDRSYALNLLKLEGVGRRGVAVRADCRVPCAFAAAAAKSVKA